LTGYRHVGLANNEQEGRVYDSDCTVGFRRLTLGKSRKPVFFDEKAVFRFPVKKAQAAGIPDALEPCVVAIRSCSTGENLHMSNTNPPYGQPHSNPNGPAHLRPPVIDASPWHLSPTDAESPVSTVSRKPFLERLLQPHVLQRMMIAGGVTLIVGLAGWLWSMGAFDNPIYAAIALGTATLSVVVSGVGLHRFTRYQMAGTGLTLLGVLVLPLNLWLYDAQGLIELSEGGHLWIPAALCCLIYAVVARELRNPVFVYTLVAGVVMTGLLILADHRIDRIGDPLSSITLLVVVGWLCVGSERLFESGASEFSRERFGKAFRKSGYALLLAGLVWQSGYEVIRMPSDWLDRGYLPLLASHPASQQFWAFSLIAISAIGFAVCAVANRPHNRSLFAVTGLLGLWAITCGLGYLQISPQLAHLVIGLNLVLVVYQLVSAWGIRELDQSAKPKLRELFYVHFGLLLFSFAQFAVWCYPDFFVWPLTAQGPIPAIQAALLSISGILAIVLTPRSGRNNESAMRALLSLIVASSSTIFALSIARVIDAGTPEIMAAAGLSIPLACVVMHWFRKRGESVSGLPSPATAACLTLVSGLLMVPGEAGLFHITSLNAGWLFAVLSATCLIVPARSPADQAFGHTALIASLAAWTVYLGISLEFGVPAILYICAVLAWGASWIRRHSGDPTRLQGFSSSASLASTYLTMSSVTTLMISLSRSFDGEAGWSHAILIAVQALTLGIITQYGQDSMWRPVFRSLLVGSLLALLVVANTNVDISPVQRLELGILLIGVIILTAGHIGLAREPEDQPSPMTSAGLVLGCVLIAIPLLAGLIIHERWDVDMDSAWARFHVWGALIAALTLLFAGVTCRVRSTTLSGALMLVVFCGTMIRIPSQMASTSVVLMIGGGCFFLTALVLSIYRDRVLAIPEKVREGRGVFKILRWR
jgi:hypothetical protein